MTVKEFYNKLTELYPESLSCEWDNDGLMCCADTSAEVKKVLVTLDVTDEALHYARDNGFDVILSHHPMIFKGLKAVCDNSLTGSRAVFAIKNGISVSHCTQDWTPEFAVLMTVSLSFLVLLI